MADIASVSRTDLRERRQKLQRQRRMKIIQAIWQTIAVSGLAGGLLWFAIQPMWVLKAPKQIEMRSGNRRLPEQAIQSLLVLSYPQSLWRIQPTAIAQSLKKQPSITQATVNRRLFPPGLIIEIKERVPVAIAQPSNDKNSFSPSKRAAVGLLDVDGVWMPLDKYRVTNPNIKLPSLKILGSIEQYRSYWPEIYQAVSQSSVKVTEIDFQNPTNLILKTELGQVHLGAPSPQISQQIKLLTQIRHLTTEINPSLIEFIDLKNSEYPLVQMNQKTRSVKPR
jgi:cell division protein FtsQ